ncbi:BnaC04g53260D [Brassica napus]|uniref:BnaC04g53260D protein n=1 Tax=Brassica napus TaxID=3708 RepID=A0A078J0J4_BRANA|nr:BnaC04g53260D [Brassica napus]
MTEVKDGVIYYVMKDGYVKSGDMTSSRRLFNEMRFRTVASWNDMINGYALNGDVSAALDLFLAMLREVKPDEVTILAVLSACNHIAV